MPPGPLELPFPTPPPSCSHGQTHMMPPASWHCSCSRPALRALRGPRASAKPRRFGSWQLLRVASCRVSLCPLCPSPGGHPQMLRAHPHCRDSLLFLSLSGKFSTQTGAPLTVHLAHSFLQRHLHEAVPGHLLEVAFPLPLKFQSPTSVLPLSLISQKALATCHTRC